MVSLFLFILSGCVGVEQSKETNPLPPHHTPKGFQNLYRPSERGFGDFLRWRFGLGPNEIPPIITMKFGETLSLSNEGVLNRVND
jgi:hypothetical protein